MALAKSLQAHQTVPVSQRATIPWFQDLEYQISEDILPQLLVKTSSPFDRSAALAPIAMVAHAAPAVRTSFTASTLFSAAQLGSLAMTCRI